MEAKVRAEICFWPLTASTTSKVKNDHADVIMQDICNKFIGMYDFTAKSSVATLDYHVSY